MDEFYEGPEQVENTYRNNGWLSINMKIYIMAVIMCGVLIIYTIESVVFNLHKIDGPINIMLLFVFLGAMIGMSYYLAIWE